MNTRPIENAMVENELRAFHIHRTSDGGWEVCTRRADSAGWVVHCGPDLETQVQKALGLPCPSVESDIEDLL